MTDRIITNILILASPGGIDVNNVNAKLKKTRVVPCDYPFPFTRIDQCITGCTTSMTQCVYGASFSRHDVEDRILAAIGEVAAAMEHKDGWYVHVMVNAGENAWQMFDFHTDGSYDNAGL